jgi:hypothetical protein
MIRNAAEYQNTREQLALAEQALKSLADEVRPQSEERYAMMAESYIELIRQLRQDIDSYLGVTAAPIEPYSSAAENVKQS